MKKSDVFAVWGRVLRNRKAFLSIELTKECPLHCPGCYAYQDEHLNNGVALRRLNDYRGEELVRRVLEVVREIRPVHLSIIGGEPLVRCHELDRILPEIDRLGVEVQFVTSAVRPIPRDWAALQSLHIVVSIDGLPEDHDRRRAPATYSRIVEHIAGHRIIVHCTITRPQISTPGYYAEFCRFWSARPEVRKIWFSLYTPQEGEESEERLTAAERRRAAEQIASLREPFPKVHMPDVVLDAYRDPPRSPGECIFAQVTTCLSADLTTKVTPCQIGGRPVCRECGCIAAAAMAGIGRVRLGGIVPLSRIFDWSGKFGRLIAPATAEAS